MRYRSLIVFRLGGWSPLLPTGFLVSRGTLVPSRYSRLRLRGCHALWPRFPTVFGSAAFACRWPATPGVRRPLVWPLPSSLATTKGIEFSFFSSGYLDVSLPRVPSMKLWIHFMVTGYCPAGFPHSEISGSRPTCGSPKLFAAYRVLHRQSVPWHPPCALVRLILPTIILPPKTWDFSPLEE